MNKLTGVLLVVSGPSGCGKTTLCRRFKEESQGKVVYSTSCTTRNPRPGEVNGKDYFFLSKEEFKTKISQGDFLEYAEVHGNFYGTLKSEVITHLKQGKDVIMDIDVQGASLVRKCQDALIQSAYVDLFVNVPLPELEARLRGRQTDSEDVIQLRLNNAEMEMASRGLYQYTFDSGDKETDFTRFSQLIEKERAKRS